MTKPKLSQQQRKFVDGVMMGKALVDAYIEAGYKGAKENHVAYSSASEIFTNPNIQEEILRRMTLQKGRTEAALSSMQDGAQNVYVRILKLDPGDNPKLLELQRKVADDLFDRGGLKPAQRLEHSGEVKVGGIEAIWERFLRKKNESSAN